ANRPRPNCRTDGCGDAHRHRDRHVSGGGVDPGRDQSPCRRGAKEQDVPIGSHRAHRDSWARLAGGHFYQRERGGDYWRTQRHGQNRAVDVCDRFVCCIDAALQPGGHCPGTHAARPFSGDSARVAGRDVSGGERLLFHPELRDADRCHAVRSLRHHANRQIFAESFVHGARPDHDDWGRRNWDADRTIVFPSGCLRKPMTLNQSTIADAARRIGIAPDELAVVLQRGRSVNYPESDYLFHESAPRRWLGLVLEGEVELLHGRHGKKVTVGRAQPGAILSESVILGPSAHGTTAVTRRGATVWQISSDEMDFVRQESPAVFYRIVEQIARRMSERLAAAAERLATGNGPPPLVGVRAERDLLGEREVPNSAYYGIHTVRALENFPFSGIRIGDYEHFVRALACVKKAASLANLELGTLQPGMAGAIAKACDEILEGKLHDAFVVDMIQGGAGTSTNMNANEVIANRALELLGHARGDYQFCHPNDHVN